MDELDESWRWGLETSRLMGERLLDLYSQLGTSVANGLDADLDNELRRARIDMERWVDLSVDVFDRAFAILQRLAADGRTGGYGRDPADSLSLEASAGATACGELWMHNVSGDEQASPGLRCAGLASASGAEIPGCHVRFQLDEQSVAGRTSRHVEVLVDVPESALPGKYHGVVLADASPDHPILLRVNLVDANAARRD